MASFNAQHVPNLLAANPVIHKAMNKLSAILITAGIKSHIRDDILQENFTTLLAMKKEKPTTNPKVDKRIPISQR